MNNLSIPVERSATYAAETLDALGQAKGTLFVQDGVIQESKHPLGRAFLGLFSSTIRAENRAALEAVGKSMRQVYGFGLKPRDSISGEELSSLTSTAKARNLESMDRFMTEMSHDFGDRAAPVLDELRRSDVYASGLGPKEMMREAHERLTLGAAGERFRGADVGADEIFQTMNSMPRFKELLESTFGVTDTAAPGEPKPLLSIEAHTRQVMDLYEQQKGHYDLQGLEASLREQPGFENFNADRFMKMALLFHDIGKGQAVHTGREQHEVTTPILRDTMTKLGFSEQEVRLAANLVDNDLLGEWQTGKSHDVAETRSRLRALAQDSGIPLKAYLNMQKLFYISDAGSYPDIRKNFMHADKADNADNADNAGKADNAGNGMLHFNVNNTDELIASFGEQFDRELSKSVSERLLAPGALLEGRVHPLELFAPDMTEGKSWNVYDLSRAVLAGEAGLRGEINKYAEPLKTTAQARLDEAVEMAKTALTMDADRWRPEHTQGVIAARLEIRDAGITADLPRQLFAVALPAMGRNPAMTSGAAMNVGSLAQFDDLRGPDSTSARFYSLVDAKGGNSRMLQCVNQLQVASSWCGTSLAVKGYLEQARSVSEDRYFHPGQNTQLAGTSARDSAAACYTRFSQAPASYWDGVHGQMFRADQVETGAVNRSVDAANAARIAPSADPEASARSFDTSMRYQIAMQMEMLSTMDFPGNNPQNGSVTIYRTEQAAVMRMYGLDMPVGESSPPPIDSDSRVGTTLQMRRSTYDSGSLYSPVAATGGNYTTTQEVPYHRIFGSFLLGATETSTQSCLHTNVFHEVLFMTDGIPSTYTGDAQALHYRFGQSYTTPPPA
ncbi:MAG: hypothetical protein LBM64_00805 [Deltaproteobacteria bacterium]|jgi:hypothetical protein|nr:hypothetical protein [Deltaproteobacteria bacterium]